MRLPFYPGFKLLLLFAERNEEFNVKWDIRTWSMKLGE